LLGKDFFPFFPEAKHRGVYENQVKDKVINKAYSENTFLISFCFFLKDETNINMGYN